MSWTVDDIPDQSGRTILITGATAGIGLEAARVLAKRNAHLMLACRNAEKMAAVAKELRTAGASAVDELVCDLSDLDSVRSCAEAQAALGQDIDVLLLNAGLAHSRAPTAQGYDLIFGTNHLGRFLLAGLLMPRVRQRVVAVSSMGHKTVNSIDWDAVSGKASGDSDWARYAESKLANLLFIEELNRRLIAAGSTIIAVGAHPGATLSDITNPQEASLQKSVMSFFVRNLAQPTADGAWPLLMAATDKNAVANAYYGPSRGILMFLPESWGAPTGNAVKNKVVADIKLAEECWYQSEKLTDFTFTI